MDPIVEYSRQVIQKGSKSFAGAARLFDADTRASAYMLYAWCRHADDEIDGQELGFAAPQPSSEPPEVRLQLLRRRTVEALAGRADDPVYAGLSRVVAKHRIPDRHPLELVEGFAMDVAGRKYLTIDDTASYCYHVAGVVGVMMAMIMGVRQRETLNRASDLGIAFQLTNISRDVIADALAGRVYLPADWLAAEGVEPTPIAVAAPENRDAVYRVTERLLNEADRYYVSARYGLPSLPVRAAWAIATARRVYRDIGGVVRSKRARAWDQRAVVGRWRKLFCIAWAGATISRAHVSGAVKSAPPRDGLWTMPGLGLA